MLFDDFIMFFTTYGLIVVSSFCFLKLVLLFWYKPFKFRFVRRNFFRIFSDTIISSRDVNYAKWPFFRATHNFLTISVYFTLFMWAVLNFIIGRKQSSHFCRYLFELVKKSAVDFIHCAFFCAELCFPPASANNKLLLAGNRKSCLG